MNDDERRHANCFESMHEFGDLHGADFGGVGQAQFDILKTIVEHVHTTGGEQSGAQGELSQSVSVKALKREALREWCSEVAATARGMVYQFPGIDELFHMPRNRNDADLLSAARSFVVEGATYDGNFKDMGLAGTWRADGTALADDFEAAVGETDSKQAASAGKTALLADWITQGSRARRILLPIGRNVYADNPEMLAAWETAVHLEKRPKSKKKPPTP